jgi:two-component system cell cycle sensor histidine kinase/response regulator CckA
LVDSSNLSGLTLPGFMMKTANGQGGLSPRRLDVVADQARDVILLVDLQGNILDANEAAVQTYGYTRAELTARSVRDLRRADSLADYQTQLSRAPHGILFETIHCRRDGSSFPCEVSARGIELRGEHCIVSVIRDLSDRKHAADVLRQTEELFAKVFRKSPVVISIIRLSDNRHVDVNDRFLQLLGLTREQVIGKTFVELGLSIDPDDLITLTNAVSTESRRDFEVRIRTRSGQVIETLHTLDFLDLGGSRCVVSFAHEITERKRLEEQLRQAQKMEAIGRLAGGVAHDFNNILTAILGHSELLLGSLEAVSPHRRQMEQIRRSALRASTLTGQLLAFSRKQVMQPKVLEPNDLISNLGAMLQRLIGEDIELVEKLSPTAGNVRADPGQLEQVVANLVVNARDAMPKGGRLTIRTAPAILDEEAARQIGIRPGPYVLIEVEDTGCGMDADTRSHVFEPFFTTKHSGKGTGLGLSTVYGIVTQSGGHVDVESTPGEGARFRVYLPRVDAPAVSQSGRVLVTSVPRGQETILLAEDDSAVRDFLQEVLSRQGYRVLIAADGPEALRVAELHTGHIHLLLTDVIMPKMTGRELAERIALLRPGIRVLFISGYPGDTIVEQGVLSPELSFVQKPFTVGDLALRVRGVLDAPAVPHKNTPTPI